VELAPLYFSRDQLTTEAYFDATDGTWLNAKNLFAIYDAVVGWMERKYLESGIGYMLKSSKKESFKFPSYLSTT
jgi:hypothetical protein